MSGTSYKKKNCTVDKDVPVGIDIFHLLPRSAGPREASKTKMSELRTRNLRFSDLKIQKLIRFERTHIIIDHLRDLTCQN